MRKPSDIVRVRSRNVTFSETAPITHNDIDDIYIFYTSDGRLIKSDTYDEAHAKWLLTKETD